MTLTTCSGSRLLAAVLPTLLAAPPTLPATTLLANTEREWQDLTAERLRAERVHEGCSTTWAFANLQRVHASLRKLVSGSGERTLVSWTTRYNGTELAGDVRGLGPAARVESSRAECREGTASLGRPLTTPASTPPSVLHFAAVGLGPSRLLDDAAPRGRDARIELLLVAMRTPPMPTVRLGRSLSDLTSGALSASESGHLL